MKLFHHRWLMEADSQTGPHKADNEDRVTFYPDPALTILCDGVGGNRCGEVAAGMAADYLQQALLHMGCRDLNDSLMLRLVRQTHEHLLQHMETDPGTEGMATTLVMAVQDGRHAWVVWAGDSRAYLLRNHELQALTRDHSFVAEKVDLGLLSEEEAAAHPLANLITSSLGGGHNSLKQIGCRRVRLHKGDRLLLCSDGVYSYLSDAELIEAGQQSAHALTARAIANHTHDNCSAICIAVR